MIFSQRSIRYFILIIVLLYSIIYLLVSKSNWISILNLVLIRELSIFIFLASIFLSFFLIDKELPKKWIAYQVSGIILIMFSIMSVFIFFVEDLFFWDSNKEQNKYFFYYSFEILGWNYILAIPYLLLLIFECSFLFARSKKI